MFYSDYASEGHLNILDQEFDSSMASLNKLLDQALDKRNPVVNENRGDVGNDYDNNHHNFGTNMHRLGTQSSHIHPNVKGDPQIYAENMNRDLKNSSSAVQAVIQHPSRVSLSNQRETSERSMSDHTDTGKAFQSSNMDSARYNPSMQKIGFHSQTSGLQLEFKIDQEKIHQSPDAAQRSRAQTERTNKSLKKDDVNIKPNSPHQRWASQQYSFTAAPNEFYSPRNNEGSGILSSDWFKNNQSRSDLNQIQSRNSNNYQRSHTISRASEDLSFHTDGDVAKATGNIPSQFADPRINKRAAGESTEYENKLPQSKQEISREANMRYRDKDSRVSLDNSYGFGTNQLKQDSLRDIVLNATPKQRNTEKSQNFSPHNSQLRSSFHRKPSIVQSPQKVSPLESRYLSPQNMKNTSLSSNKKKGSPQLFDENIGEYERNLHYIHKYTTQEALESLDNFPTEKEALINSMTKTPKPLTDISQRQFSEQGEEEDLIDKIVIMRSPAANKDTEAGLVSVYQQVSEVYDDGTKYYGEKLLGKRHGKGTYHYKEGYKYEGNWDQDQMSGYGTLWLTEDLKWYEGEWLNNLFHGKGSLYNLYSEPLDSDKVYAQDLATIENGWTKYEGQFDQGLKDGLGSLYLTNGDFYIGNFRKNKTEGRGAYTKPNKTVVVGKWEGDQLMETY